MTKHYKLLNDLYENACNSIVKKKDRDEPSLHDKLLAACNVIDTYHEHLTRWPDSDDKLTGFLETRVWQKVKQQELLGT